MSETMTRQSTTHVTGVTGAMVRQRDGHHVYVRCGQPLPSDIAEGEVERLARYGVFAPMDPRMATALAVAEVERARIDAITEIVNEATVVAEVGAEAEAAVDEVADEATDAIVGGRRRRGRRAVVEAEAITEDGVPESAIEMARPGMPPIPTGPPSTLASELP